jgi:hypothetical protein
MQALLRATPRFIVTLSLSEYHTLKRCSQCHYDGVCACASKLGGFLYAWDFCISEGTDRNKSSSTFEVLCDFRQIDTCLKILEVPPPDVAREAYALSAQLRKCLMFSDTYMARFDIQIPL